MVVSGWQQLPFYISYTYGVSWVLFNFPFNHPFIPVMSGDGSKIVFSSNTGANVYIYNLSVSTASTVAIGQFAGQYSQGLNSIAIGYSAGQSAQPIGSFYVGTSVLPVASSTNVPPTNPGGSFLGGLAYSALTGEIFYNTAKTFVIDHPLDPSRYLVHACMEGPEEGVYQRGAGISARATERTSLCGGQEDAVASESDDTIIATVVTLESYSDALAYDYTVQVTAIYGDDDSLAAEPRCYSASRVKDGKFTVYGPPGEFSWHVIGKRRGPFDVVVPKQDVVVKGDGPYTYLAALSGVPSPRDGSQNVLAALSGVPSTRDGAL